MIIQIKCTDYSGRLNHDSYTTIDLEEFLKNDDIDIFWDIYDISNSQSISRLLTTLLLKSVKNLIKLEIQKEDH